MVHPRTFIGRFGQLAEIGEKFADIKPRGVFQGDYLNAFDKQAGPGASSDVLTAYRIINEAEEACRDLADIPDNYRVLFLQGGASLQFSMAPMNLLRSEPAAAEAPTLMRSRADALYERVVVSLAKQLAETTGSKNLCIAGGGALIKNLDVLLRKETGLPVYLSEEPVTGTVMGAGTALEQLEILEAVTLG